MEAELELLRETLVKELSECGRAESRISSFIEKFKQELEENKQRKLAIEIRLSQVEQKISEQE